MLEKINKTFQESLKSLYSHIKKNKKIVLLSFIILFLILTYSQYIKTLIVSIIFILFSSISKIYHKFFKSTIGIDLVLFLTLIISITYNQFLGFFVGFSGLILADMIATKINYTSLISLIGLTMVILLSKFLINFPIIIGMIILTLIYELISVILYYLMGSSPQKIFIFLISHIIFNLFMILSFAETIKNIII